MTVTIRYFASLANMRNLEEEHIELDPPCTAGQLYEQLKNKHNFTFEQEHIKVAINHEYKQFSDQLKDADEIVFISPVSGG